MDFNLDSLFHSKRLRYGPLSHKNKTHVDFLHEVIASSTSTLAQWTTALLGPRRAEDTEKVAEVLAGGLLAVIIYLPADSQRKDDKSPEDEGKEGRGEDIPIGWLHMSASPTTRHHGNTDIGIVISPAYQNRGYGTEALEWGLDWAFQMARLHAVRLTVFSFNEGAIRLYERLGFKREGCTREAMFVRGKWYDHIFSSILEHEWRALKGIDQERQA